MKKEEKKVKKSLSRKIVLGAVLLSVAIAALSCVVGFYQYRDTITKLYNANGYVVGEIILNTLDNEKIAEYTRTWKADDYYDELTGFMKTVEESSKAAYIYIMVPSADGTSMKYVYDSSGMEFASEEELNPDGFEKILAIYNTGERSSDYFVRKSKKYGYLTSSILPVKDAAGETCALLLVDTYMELIVTTLAGYVIRSVLICIGILIVFCNAYWMYMKKSIINPIDFIGDKAYEFSKNAEKVTEELADIKTGDELQTLAESVLRMEHDIINYVDDLKNITAEKERIGAELDLGRKIQASSLPSIFPPFPDKKEFDIYASMDPAKEVGGDFYDFFLVDDTHLALVIADVSGKGVGAALFMMISKTLINNQSMFTESPAEVLALVNERLCNGNEAEMFVTVWLGIIDLTTGVMKAANAGHEYPVIKKKDGEFELLKDKHGMVLGGLEGLKFKEYEINFEPGDKLYVYTDGVPEATNANNELFGTDRMLEALNSDKEASLKDLLLNVRKSIDGFVLEAPQFDDITMLSFVYNGMNEND